MAEQFVDKDALLICRACKWIGEAFLWGPRRYTGPAVPQNRPCHRNLRRLSGAGAGAGLEKVVATCLVTPDHRLNGTLFGL
jgi:hypothetical protein